MVGSQSGGAHRKWPDARGVEVGRLWWHRADEWSGSGFDHLVRELQWTMAFVILDLVDLGEQRKVAIDDELVTTAHRGGEKGIFDQLVRGRMDRMSGSWSISLRIRWTKNIVMSFTRAE